MFNRFSARHAHNVYAFHVNLFATWRHVHEVSRVSPYHGGSGHNLLPVSENVVNSNLQVWKRLTKNGHALLEAFNARALAWKRIMFNEACGYEFLRSFHVAFVE